MSSWGSPLLDPKKLQNQQFYIIDWIRKKLLVDVANLATCCYDDYDVLFEVWEPCANTMLVVLLPKLWFWIENHDWHNCFWMFSWGSPLLDPKKLQNQQFYIIDWIRKKLLVKVANLAILATMKYDWMFLEPYIGGKADERYVSSPVAKTLVLDWKSWLAQLFLDVFVTLCGVNPYWTQKSFKINNFM